MAFDHDKDDLYEACGLTREKVEELKDYVHELNKNRVYPISRVIERVSEKYKDDSLCAVLLGMNIGSSVSGRSCSCHDEKKGVSELFRKFFR